MQSCERRARLLRFIAQRSGIAPANLRLDLRALSGGLEALGVYSVLVRSRLGHGPRRFVVKELAGAARREAGIHGALATSDVRVLAPHLLGIEEQDGIVTMYLELIRSAMRWPWDDVESTRQVLCSLATLHTSVLPGVAASAGEWDYEAELVARGAALLATLEQSRSALRELGLRVPLPQVRRVVDMLPVLRSTLLGSSLMPSTTVHGDVHSGNVRLRPASGGSAVVLLDWGRARTGSPFEDVSSWLQSLAFWEPQARRRHDTLLRAYFDARGLHWPPSRELRRLYWLSAASNCIAGSLRYHALRATDPRAPPGPRETALHAVRDQLRILRRADACT